MFIKDFISYFDIFFPFFVLYLIFLILAFMKNRKDIEENIKDLLIRIRKIYKIKLSGYYKIKVYQNDLYGLIFECIKEDDLDFFPDFCDLKINILYDSKILLESDDFFIFNNNKKTYKKGNKFYINIKDLNELEIIKLSEFCKIKYC